MFDLSGRYRASKLRRWTRPHHRAPNALVAPALLLAIAGTASDLCAQREQRDATPARVAIESHWSALDSAWNARDAVRFSRLYAQNVSFEFVDRGQSFHGRTAIRRYFGEQFPRFSSDLRHLTTIRDIRALAQGVYAVDGRVEILREGADTTALLRTFAIFAVMNRGDDEWTIEVLRIYQVPASAAGNARPSGPANR